jgi:hypothetical protein
LLTLLQQYRWELEEIQSGQFLEDVEEFSMDRKTHSLSTALDAASMRRQFSSLRKRRVISRIGRPSSSP